MPTTWEDATRAQYDDDTNLAARQALFDYLTHSDPLPAPVGDMSLLAGQRVLDIGCGNGRFLGGAIDVGAQAIGLDANVGILRTSRQAVPTAPLGVADAVALPLADNSIDTVLALWMLYHVDDRPAALREFRRVLRPGGVVVATTNSGEHSALGQLFCDAVAEVVGRSVDHWHAPLPFVTENAVETLGSVFGDVDHHLYSNSFEVTEVEPVVRYVGSLGHEMQEYNGPFELADVLAAVGRRAEQEIALSGAVSMTVSRSVTIARA